MTPGRRKRLQECCEVQRLRATRPGFLRTTPAVLALNASTSAESPPSTVTRARGSVPERRSGPDSAKSSSARRGVPAHGGGCEVAVAVVPSSKRLHTSWVCVRRSPSLRHGRLSYVSMAPAMPRNVGENTSMPTAVMRIGVCLGPAVLIQSLPSDERTCRIAGPGKRWVWAELRVNPLAIPDRRKCHMEGARVGAEIPAVYIRLRGPWGAGTRLSGSDSNP
jgi:hypothetical protein